MAGREVSMVCATSVMKPGRTRIGRISGDIVLPRTVPVLNLVAAIIGGALGLLLVAAIGPTSETVAVGLGLGAGAGWFVVSYSPLRNESLLKWFELTLKTQTRARYIGGRRVTVAVGVAACTPPSSGTILLARSAVRVPAGQFDERGAVRSVRNGNVLGVIAADPGAVPLPADVAAPGPRRARRGADDLVSPPAADAGAPASPLGGPARSLKD